MSALDVRGVSAGWFELRSGEVVVARFYWSDSEVAYVLEDGGRLDANWDRAVEKAKGLVAVPEVEPEPEHLVFGRKR